MQKLGIFVVKVDRLFPGQEKEDKKQSKPVEDTGPPASGRRLPDVAGGAAPRRPRDGVQDGDDGGVGGEAGGGGVGGVVDGDDAAVLHRQPLALVPDGGKVLLPVPELDS